MIRLNVFAAAADEEEVAASAVPSGSSSPAAEVRRMQQEEDAEVQTKPSRTASGGSVSCDTHATITLTSHACHHSPTDLSCKLQDGDVVSSIQP